VISLTDLSILWKRLGTDLDEDRSSFVVDSAAKQTITGKDVEFGGPAVSLGDINDDGVPDIETLIYQHSETGQSLAIFSDSDGALLEQLSFRPTRMTLDRQTPLAVLNRSGRTAVATIGRQANSSSLEIVIVQW
jgi:hypothetical protein